MEAPFRGDKVWDVRVACLGEDPENEYFFNLIEKDGLAGSGTNFYCGNGMPNTFSTIAGTEMAIG